MKAIDLFAGAGGFSTGAQLAGCDVVWAANHWPDAVEWHTRNHPTTDHLCQDLHQADWSRVPEHDIMLASPCCQGHSKARGKLSGNPQHDASRSTAWAVVSAAEYHRPSVIVVENVPEFRDWSLYPAWSQAMDTLGYSLSHCVLDAADHGAPQHRQRLFIILTRSMSGVVLELPKQPHIPASSFLNFDHTRPGNMGGWSPVNKPGRSLATLARVARGRQAFGDRFIMPYYGSGSGLTGRSIDRPIGTLTTRARWAVVNGDRMRMVSTTEARAAMTFPDTYQIPSNVMLANHLLGNAVCPEPVRHLINAIKKAA